MRGLFAGLVFMALSVGQVAASDLAGSEWGFENSDKRFIQFKADGKVFGHGGCNRFFGGYEMGSDHDLSFSALGATRMACPEPDMKKEMEFLGLLEKTTSVKIQGVRLSLFDAKSELLAELVRKDWD